LVIARDWVQKAENDLKNATYTLGMGEDCPTDTVCFHAQQCVEKYLKALLVLKGINFPKTHDIKELIVLLPSKSRPKLTPEEQRRLADYATVTRYPGDYEPISLAETRRTVKIARRV
jgi:HEPN domain-containing protein